MKGTLTQGPPPVPQLGSAVRTAGEGGRVSPGAQAQPLCKITLHSVSIFCRMNWALGRQRIAQVRGKWREIALERFPLKGPTSESGIELKDTGR